MRKVLLFFALFIGAWLFFKPIFQGAFIGTSFAVNSINVIGIIIFIGALVLVVVEGESDLETNVKKLFVRDQKTGKIRIADPDYLLGNEMGHSVYKENADEVLEELDKEFGQDKDIKGILQEALKKGGYFELAYKQRDIASELKRGSVPFYADMFLKQWDPKYKKFEAPKNLYLVYNDNTRKKITTDGPYDTREILPILEDNIPGFKIEDETIGTHDVISYQGARFQIMAGSFNRYEVPRQNIMRTLNRIVREDVKRGNINEEDKATRLEVLKNYVFG